MVKDNLVSFLGMLRYYFFIADTITIPKSVKKTIPVPIPESIQKDDSKINKTVLCGGADLLLVHRTQQKCVTKAVCAVCVYRMYVHR